MTAQAPRRPFVAIDFETADNLRDSACAIGLVRVEGGEIVGRGYHLIRPPRSVFTTTFIHGITWRDVAKEPDFGELWPRIAPWFEGVDFVAAHNASFDRSVLRASCAMFGLPEPQLPYLCTVKVARQAWALKPAKLSNCAAHIGFDLQHHHAGSDAEACARIVIAAEADRGLPLG
jgi:DNA polymerase-3 subunit epsilon